MDTTNNLEKEVKKRKQQFFQYSKELNFSDELAKEHWSSEHEKLLKKNGQYRKDSLRKLENFLIVYDSMIRVKNNPRRLLISDSSYDLSDLSDWSFEVD